MPRENGITPKNTKRVSYPSLGGWLDCKLEMDDQRLEDKKKVIEAFRTGKTRGELSFVLNEYFRKYCVSKNLGEFEKKESPYDIISAPLLSHVI